MLHAGQEGTREHCGRIRRAAAEAQGFVEKVFALIRADLMSSRIPPSHREVLPATGLVRGRLSPFFAFAIDSLPVGSYRIYEVDQGDCRGNIQGVGASGPDPGGGLERALFVTA